MRSLFLASLLFSVTLSADYHIGEGVPGITPADRFGKKFTVFQCEQGRILSVGFITDKELPAFFEEQ